jgi:hypothetical protein
MLLVISIFLSLAVLTVPVFLENYRKYGPLAAPLWNGETPNDSKKSSIGRIGANETIRSWSTHDHTFPAEVLSSFQGLNWSSAAADLGILLQPSYSIVICKVPFVERFGSSITTYAISYNCTISLSNSSQFIDRDLAVGFSPSQPYTFQHNLIDGLPRAGMMVEWVLGDTNKRALLCCTIVCFVLSSVVPLDNLIDISTLQFPFYARSIQVADLHLGNYPLGSLWVVDKLLPKEFGNEVLYLSRNGSANRFIVNEDQLIARIAAFCQAQGRILNVMPHHSAPDGSGLVLSHWRHTISLFERASVVIGLHGGSFSNIVFCHKRTKIIEINNKAERRNVFAVMAFSKGLDYKLFPISPSFLYHGSSITLSEVQIDQLINMI